MSSHSHYFKFGSKLEFYWWARHSQVSGGDDDDVAAAINHANRLAAFAVARLRSHIGTADMNFR